MPTEITSAAGGVERRPTSLRRTGRPSARRSWSGRRRTGAAALAAFAVVLAGCGDSGVFVADTSTSPSTLAPDTTPPPPPTAVATVAGTALPTSGDDGTDGTDAGVDAVGTTAAAGADGDGAAATTVAAACDGYTPNDALPVQRCDSGRLVLAVQLALQSAGYDITALDGEFGDQTDAAVRAFQEAEGLTVDGIVGNQTWGAIDFPDNVATDANGDGAISPDEVTVG